MCWNFEVSILSFFIGVFISYLYYKRGLPFDKPMCFLIFTYSFVQLCESIIWLSLTNKTVFGFDSICVNKFITKCLYIILFSHLIGLGYGMLLDSNYTNYLPLIIGIAFFIYTLLKLPSNLDISQPSKNSNGHLVWSFNDYDYILLCILALFLVIIYTDLKYSYIAILFYVLTYIISRITNYDGLSSYWCWISAFLSFIPLLLTYNNSKY